MDGSCTPIIIGARDVVVKPDHPSKPTKSQSRTGTKSFRPDVLSKMPRSCNVVFDVLRSSIDCEGRSATSMRYLAQVSQLSDRTVKRAGWTICSILSERQGAEAERQRSEALIDTIRKQREEAKREIALLQRRRVCYTMRWR